MIKTVIFDLDGTLLDTLCDLHLAVNYALMTLGFSTRSKEEVRAFVGNGAAVLIARAAPAGCDEETRAKLLSLFHEYYEAHSLDHTEPYPGVIELLEELKRRGVACALVSNKPHYAVVELCERFFGDQLFPVLGQSNRLPRKPAPDMLLEALKTLQCTAEDCVYVGDSEVDVQCAQNAGLSCICVTWGFREKEQLQHAGATLLCGDTQQLLHTLLGDQ